MDFIFNPFFYIPVIVVSGIFGTLLFVANVDHLQLLPEPLWCKLLLIIISLGIHVVVAIPLVVGTIVWWFLKWVAEELRLMWWFRYVTHSKELIGEPERYHTILNGIKRHYKNPDAKTALGRKYDRFVYTLWRRRLEKYIDEHKNKQQL